MLNYNIQIKSKMNNEQMNKEMLELLRNAKMYAKNLKV